MNSTTELYRDAARGAHRAHATTDPVTDGEPNACKVYAVACDIVPDNRIGCPDAVHSGGFQEAAYRVSGSVP